MKVAEELKEDMEKVKERMCEQNGNISEAIEKLKKKTLELKSAIIKIKMH